MISSREEIPKNSHPNMVIINDSLSLKVIMDMKKVIVKNKNFFML